MAEPFVLRPEDYRLIARQRMADAVNYLDNSVMPHESDVEVIEAVRISLAQIAAAWKGASNG